MSQKHFWLEKYFCLCAIILAVQATSQPTSEEETFPKIKIVTGNAISPPTSVLSDYWTTMLNVTYYDPDKGVWNSLRTESARYFFGTKCTCTLVCMTWHPLVLNACQKNQATLEHKRIL